MVSRASGFFNSKKYCKSEVEVPTWNGRKFARKYNKYIVELQFKNPRPKWPERPVSQQNLAKNRKSGKNRKYKSKMEKRGMKRKKEDKTFFIYFPFVFFFLYFIFHYLSLLSIFQFLTCIFSANLAGPSFVIFYRMFKVRSFSTHWYKPIYVTYNI